MADTAQFPMLITAKSLRGYGLDSHDGPIGKVEEFYFDDRFWTVRYLVANTGDWLSGRQVLLSPYDLAKIDRDEHKVGVDLTRAQIAASPSIESDMPVSRQLEEEHSRHYGWPHYWTGSDIWGSHPYIVRDREQWSELVRSEHSWDPNLRSTASVVGHHLHTVDGEIGHVEDFVIDDDSWTIRYLVVATSNWWPGKKVLVAPLWIDRVSWSERLVFTGLSRESIEHSPAYSESALLNREYEESLYHHHGRSGYWSAQAVVIAALPPAGVLP